MPEPRPVVVVTCATMTLSQLGLSTAAQRIVQALADEHLHASCVVEPIDTSTWAIVGTLPYEGEVILAEFASREEAWLALKELAALDPDITVR